MVLKTGKRRETGALVGRPRRCSGHRSADRAARVSLYGRHVLARRVSRAGGQFEFRVVLPHLRIIAFPPACFEKRADSSFGTRSPRPFQRPGQPCGGLQRPVSPVGPVRALSQLPWSDIGCLSISVYCACCRARREVNSLSLLEHNNKVCLTSGSIDWRLI